MELTKVGLLFVLVALSTSNAFNTVTPHDKEVVYNWQALIRAGTHFPARFGSQFALHGKVHVQANDNSTHVKITDLTYKIYNGILDHEHELEAHTVPVPHEVEDIHKVFRVVYDHHGHAIGIATEKDEKEFSRNIKRAIATILQVDNSVVKESHKHPHAFVTQEHSIHGYGDVDYNVIPHADNVVEVHKMHDMHHSHHLYQYFFTNTEETHCDADFEEPIMHNSVKKYTIANQDGHRVVKHIDTQGVIVYYPFQAKSDAQFIFVNQTFELAEVVPVQQQLQVKDEHYDNHLTYHTTHDLETEAMPDITTGRHVVNYEKLIPQVQEILQDVHHYLHDDHIHTKEPDTKRGQAVNRVQRLLKRFTVEKLEELQKSLSGEALHVFHRILPLVGTRASAIFIRNLVVNKAVSDDVAIEMLQHLPEHVVIPTTSLVTDLEKLIHLGEDVHWNVRRVAILSFASLIHKAHMYEQHQEERKHDEHIDHHSEHSGHHEDHSSKHEEHHEHAGQHHDDHELDKIQQHYEKYVVEYVNKIKNSQDYKVQMTYTLGLFNMKLHSIIEHMTPAFNGEWSHDRHLRFLSLMATVPSIHRDSNPDTVIETLWPIMTNREEHVEMRILAYYFIMESQPSPSRLSNVFSYMMHEPHEEMYHFHYTYVQSMMQSNDPCKEDTRVKLAHLMKFMHPPSHGQSSAYLYDYRDVNYGFSAAVQNYYIKTNNSQIYGIAASSQNVHVHHEDYMYYIKIHGLQHTNVDTTNILTDILRKRVLKPVNNKDIHIEVAVIRQEHVINTYYFDEHNLHELNYLLDFFTKETHSVTKDLLHISYHRYHKALIPTDLGTPALWEYMMPVVQQHNISITKEVSNKVIDIHVHNRHVNWIHYRHGLTFYNPIADVWQGVNRYHAFDAVLPLHFDITINTQQQSMQISWKKHDNPQMNVAGLRSHVKQMVFVKDDYHRNVLVQSSPNAQEYQVVSNGKEYRNDYTLVDEDDLNTGHKMHVGIYDCGYHVSNGSYNHLMQLFRQPFTKHYESPISHIWTTFANWHHYAIYFPRPGIYGYIVRVEPSQEHVVSNIDLSVRVNHEMIKDDKYHYTPGGKISTRMTYAVKNKEQSLKTWDVNAIVDMNPGHTVNSLKMHLTRIIPGQKDYKVCVDGVKKWTQKGVTGHLNVAMSQSPDGKCVKDDAVIDITMTGERSHEQDHEHHIYGACHYVIPYSVPHYHTLQCLAAHSSVRHYVYNVKTTNVPTEFKKTFAHWWDNIKGHYMSYYTYQDEHVENVGEHNLKIDVTYPMQFHEVDVHVTTPQHIYGLTGVPTNYWRPLGLIPDSTVYSHLFVYAHQSGEVDHCVVHHDHHHLNHRHHVQEKVPNEWTLYVGDVAQDPQEAVYVKHVADDKIAVKVVDHGHTLEIVPQGDSHQVTLDGKEVSGEEHHHHESWVSYHVFGHDVNHPVAVMFPQSGFHLEYDGHRVVIVVPREEEQWNGHCYTHH